MNELKNGDMCYVSDVSPLDAIARAQDFNPWFYIGKLRNGHSAVEHGEGVRSSYKYAIPIPKKEMVPFTLETFPKGWAAVRRGASAPAQVVLEAGSMFVATHRVNVDYENLQQTWQYTTDGINWNKCEVEV